MKGYRIDSLSVLPSLCGSQDAYKILSLCPSVQSALKVTSHGSHNILHWSL